MSYIAQLFQNRTNIVFNNRGQYIDLFSHCKGKSVGLLFSAYWCKPCRELCPDIIKYYEKHRGGKDFEIIYISGDTDQGAFDKYFQKMPWLALDFNEQPLSDYLNAKYKVTKLPLLVVIDGDTGKVKIEDALEFYEEELVEKQKKAITKVTIKK